MANKIFRAHAITEIRRAVEKASSAALLDHQVLRGSARENAIDEVFQPFLPSDYLIGTGNITDAGGKLSSQIDLIIYNPRILPPVLMQPAGREGIFPVEACFYAVEVKSQITATEMKSVVASAKKLRELEYASEIYMKNGMAIRIPTLRAAPVLFAFGSDMSGAGKTELERYAESDPNWNSDPLIAAFCIIGVGYWNFVPQAKRWRFWEFTANYDEAINFIAGIANSLQMIFDSRLTPRLGHYLIDQENSAWASEPENITKNRIIIT